jgi:hypothetical protein
MAWKSTCDVHIMALLLQSSMCATRYTTGTTFGDELVIQMSRNVVHYRAVTCLTFGVQGRERVIDLNVQLLFV